MFWTEKTDTQMITRSDNVQDLSFRITCRELPTDHAWNLYEQTRRLVPWIEHEPCAAIHGVYGAASGNGWSRPASGAGNTLQLSHRTRLTLRLPVSRIRQAAEALENQLLDVDGFPLRIGGSRCRKLAPSGTVLARSVSGNHVNDEERFMHEIQQMLESLDIHPGKILCGLAHSISVNTSRLPAKSVLFADLDPSESVVLQETGLGSHGLLGCGIFLPYKSLCAVHEATTH